MLAEHARLVAEVIPLHKRLQDAGRIEITTTPSTHPILPLILNTDLAKVATPDVELPPRFFYPLDAIEQVTRGVQFYTDTFGQPPKGMWPAEGAVAQEIVNMVGNAGIQWMATDEEVLARSLGQTGFARNAEDTVQDADTLYRPYIASTPNNQVYTIFRDKVISDKVGFTYSGTPGAEAADDFINRILAIRQQLQDSGAEGPHLVSVILDGENAWENYPNDGKDFLNGLYQQLEEQQQLGTIQTITPSAFIAQFPDQPKLEKLWAGSWVSPDYLTWIGEPEENRAWDVLGQVRNFAIAQEGRVDDATYAQIMDQIYTAEGSDWFWWYGADQNSGDDGSFDAQFRATLARVYELAGQPVPTFLKVPIIPQTAQPPAVGATALISPTIDGVAGEGEWDGAGYFSEEGGVQANPNQVANQLWYGFDKGNLYLRHGQPASLGRRGAGHARRLLPGAAGRRQGAAVQPHFGAQRHGRNPAGLRRQCPGGGVHRRRPGHGHLLHRGRHRPIRRGCQRPACGRRRQHAGDRRALRCGRQAQRRRHGQAARRDRRRRAARRPERARRRPGRADHPRLGPDHPDSLRRRSRGRRPRPRRV